MHVIGAYTLKREACVSSQTAVFSKRKSSYICSTLGSQACPFDVDSSVDVSIVVRTTFVHVTTEPTGRTSSTVYLKEKVVYYGNHNHCKASS